jgi:cytochrome c oxidase subunit 4
MSNDAKTHHHILPLKLYINVGLALLALTVLTVVVSRVHLGPFNMVVAMVIAGTKAMLVALFFMHLKYDNKLYLTVFVAAIVFLVLFIVFTMFDTERRGDVNAEESGRIQQNAAMYDSLPATPVHGTEHEANAGSDSTTAPDSTPAPAATGGH